MTRDDREQAPNDDDKRIRPLDAVNIVLVIVVFALMVWEWVLRFYVLSARDLAPLNEPPWAITTRESATPGLTWQTR